MNNSQQTEAEDGKTSKHTVVNAPVTITGGGQIAIVNLRDYFAGMALQGYIASVTQSPDAEGAAEACYRYADAMLIQREKGIKS